MAKLRFKKSGTPFVDFRAHGKRHRPEFTRLKDAQKFLILADTDPIEAYGYWMKSQSPKEADRNASFLSLKEKIESFKENYCAKRVNAKIMQNLMDTFFTFLINKYHVTDLDIREIIFEDLEDFQTHLKKTGRRKKTGISKASVNRYFSTIKTFFKRQFMARAIPVDVSALIENFDIDVVQRGAWQTESTPLLIKSLENKNADPALVEIVKSSEWSPFGPIDYARLKWKHIDFTGGEIRTFRMKGKGKRDWIVPLIDGYRDVLKSILKRHKAAGFGGPDDYVYLDKAWKEIGPGWVSKNLERHRKALGIKEVPYSSRHRIITEIAKRTDRDTASKFAGHASIRTTEKHYLISDDKDLKKKIKDAFK